MRNRKPPSFRSGAIRLHSHFPDEHRHDAEHIAAHPDFEAGDRGHAVPPAIVLFAARAETIASLMRDSPASIQL